MRFFQNDGHGKAALVAACALAMLVAIAAPVAAGGDDDATRGDAGLHAGRVNERNVLAADEAEYYFSPEVVATYPGYR